MSVVVDLYDQAAVVIHVRKVFKQLCHLHGNFLTNHMLQKTACHRTVSRDYAGVLCVVEAVMRLVDVECERRRVLSETCREFPPASVQTPPG